jgi:acetylornithine deacetylase/succinyl-diaminopimelate desuccinylase-like protein
VRHPALPLVAALALAAMAPAPVGAQPRTPVYVPGKLTADQRLAREIYEELVEINTGVETGNVTTAAVAMARRFREAGIPEADIFVGGPRPEKHNVVARIRGRSSAQRPILLLAHLDVVEALKADWSPDLDPFVFTERDGYYYGRGTADDKAMAAIFVANAYRLRREGYVPDRDIVIALTADEESGPANGVDWLLTTHPALVEAGMVINEGGGGTLRDGKPLFQSLQVAQKVTTNFTLRATNRGGHSSVPRDDNAITALADALSRLGRHHFPISLSDVTREYFAKTAGVESPAMGRAMRALVADPRDTAAAGVVARDARYGSILRTTCVATMLSGGHATNALPQLAEANVNCRILPSETAEQVRDALARVVGDTAVQVLVRTQRPPSPTAPLLPEIVGPVTQITRDLFGDIPVIPTMSTGANDSRFFLARGVPSYGVSGLFSDPAVDARAHGRDERMAVRSFYEGQEFLYRLTRALTAGRRTVP